jgi:hypothetical protein
MISENYDRTMNVLAENLKVSTLCILLIILISFLQEHTKFEPSKLKDNNGDCKLKT